MKASHSLLRMALLATSLVTVITTRDAQADDSAPPAAANSASLAGGAQIYSHICQACHMPDGQGAVGAGFYPKLAGNPKLASWQYVALTVLSGRNGMPPFGLPNDAAQERLTVHLDDAQVADVVNYVRSRFGARYKDKVTEAQIAKLEHPDK